MDPERPAFPHAVGGGGGGVVWSDVRKDNPMDGHRGWGLDFATDTCIRPAAMDRGNGNHGNTTRPCSIIVVENRAEHGMSLDRGHHIVTRWRMCFVFDSV